ncbi:MAG: tRNA pseudouridine(13) synthase TruD [Planctomycetaceae bacterium]|nr:tRNA pseudouridine(13) synthase TruD [Planctomycetaceae bacterium]
MKIKRLPEDFQVSELSQFAAGGGSYALYRMSKRSLGTPEAIDEIVRRWHLPRARVSYGGLKDRHAITQQHVTIYNGPPRNMSEKNLELYYLGQCDRAFTPKDIDGNRFTIVIRDLSKQGLAEAVTALDETGRDGLPNYFDDQRFGSVGESGEFIARAWCHGDFERALWLALADPNPDDRPDERVEKRLLREHWGRWPECKAVLARSHRRSVVTYMADKPPDRPDYRGAFARLKIDLRGLYLAAFQSFLWNRMLAISLRRQIPPQQLVDVALKLDSVPFYKELDPAARDALFATELPLPSARLHLEPGPTLSLIEEVLHAVGLELRELRVKYPRDSFFSKGSRAAAVRLGNHSHEPGLDEIYPGRHKLKLSFDLPRGAYATILVKRLTECGAVPVDAEPIEGSEQPPQMSV